LPILLRKSNISKLDYRKPRPLETALRVCDVLTNAMGTEETSEESKHALRTM